MGEVKLTAEVLAFAAIFSVLLMFFFFYYTAKKKILQDLVIKPLFPSGSAGSLEFISFKLTGILFTGIIPFIIFVLILRTEPSRIGLVIGQTFYFWYLLILLMLVTAIISFNLSKGSNVQERSPELKIMDWFPRHIVLSVSAWVLYILGYEFLFRGVLWFLCYEAFGFWPALVINLLLYFLVHLPQGKFMAIGALPVGIVLCLLSHLTGSFIAAFLIHSFIAVLTDLFSLYHNHEVRLHLSDTGK
jgi:membrane protease YdiL (CAAX protease family)